MKIKSVIIPVVTLVAGVSAVSYFSGNEAVYKPRQGEFNYNAAYSGKGISGAMEWSRAVRANQNTGRIEMADVIAAEQQVQVLRNSKSRGALNLTWTPQGPDNVGGRTRAFLIDTVSGKYYAGGVSGGLWYSTNQGAVWQKVNDNAENLAVSCITQTTNGDIYYGTGEMFTGGFNGISHNSGGFPGRGIFKSTDGINFTQLSFTNPTNGNSTGEEWAYVSRVVAHPTLPNRIYAGTNRGVRVSNDSGATWESDWIKVGSIFPNQPVDDIELTSDGGFVVSMGDRIYFSANGEKQTFTNITPSIMPTSLSRLELATAPSNPNVMYAVTARSTGGGLGHFEGVYLSENKGVDWIKIKSESPDFRPFGENGQGYYDNIGYVHPHNAGEFYFGGVQLWRWRKVNFNPVSGYWERIAVEFPDSPNNPAYVHADKHEILARPGSANDIFVLTDGGVFKTENRGATFFPQNRNYNVTQFYSVAFSGTGEIIGGTQDNGTQYVDPAISLDAREVTGGDGGYAEISMINSDILFSSLYYGATFRSEDRGNNVSTFYSPGLDSIVSAVSASFVTPIRLWESFNDPLSLDSVWYKHPVDATTTVNPGDVIKVKSRTNDFPFDYTSTTTLAPGDSILVPDPVQAQLALGLVGQVWICLNPLNTTEAPVWVQIASFPGVAQPMRFTKDGNTMFFGTQGGLVYRVDGISQLGREDETTSPFTVSPKVTVTQVGSFGRAVNDIDIDPNNNNNVVVVLGNYGNTIYVQRATNAMTTTGTANWVSRQGIGTTALPRMPVYSVIVDKTDPKRVILGTEYGIYSTADITVPNPQWSDENDGFPNVPTYMLRQQTLDNNWDNNILNSGCIYVGTHGRGFWKSCTLGSPDVSVDEKENTPDVFKIYPNPASSLTNMDVVLSEQQNLTVKIYDLNGRLVKSERLGSRGAGAHKLQVAISDVSAGTYILSVEGTSYRKATRLSIVR